MNILISVYESCISTTIRIYCSRLTGLFIKSNDQLKSTDRTVCAHKSSSLFQKKNSRVCRMSTNNSRNRIKANLGSGAICRVQSKFLHPRKLVAEHFMNISSKDDIGNLIALKVEERKINYKTRNCIIFRHETVAENNEFYACIPYTHVVTPGSSEHFFNKETYNNNASLVTGEVDEDGVVNLIGACNEEGNGVELPESAHHHRSSNKEDISFFRNLGLDVDDDNDPLPENVPTEQEETNSSAGLKENQTWGFSGIDYRKAAGFFKSKPQMKDCTQDDLYTKPILWYFLFFLGWPILHLVIKCTNKKLGDKPTNKGEFLRFLGLWFLMSTISGSFDRREYWSSIPPDITGASGGAPYRFNRFMSKNRFEAILKALRYTDEKPPTYEDKFFQVRQLIKLWNQNMKERFEPGWLTCIDESMSIWTNRWTCPGWVFCPRKPNPFGFEFHDIGCVLARIIFGIELVEGKDKPKGRPKDPLDNDGPTVGLLLRLTRSIWGAGKVVILDSGFCVLQGIIRLKINGVFALSLIKKRRYWGKGVPGDAMNDRLKGKPIGSTDAIHGKKDGVNYHFFMQNDKDYTMKLMGTYSSLHVNEDSKRNRRHTIDDTGKATTQFFQHAECFEHYYQARHCIDDHNHQRHQLPSLEDTWKTIYWENRIFQFILAISEVNAFNAYHYFCLKPQGFKSLTIHQFRQKLANSLINNEYISVEEEMISSAQKRKREEATHELLSAPKHARCFDHARQKWDLSAIDPYQRHLCKIPGCKNRTKLYCSCNTGHWICYSCFGSHVEEKVLED